ncbi:hypothetical protein SAMN05444280_13728 [Tangfeifania diversioriginum]|uniref:Outer membrane protein beta-barrel domain-containing protein n=1 Tax=Tangfeifania diversioriginum TaxID=1168035 RepID=A0A1M6MYS1_9BACT|nr:hypothetical protein [Tangfeifania diversioriginum]SHJ88599.1 hypothetical protein SAMN05444280_13728 [Tangfeifania diversioriginum]
MYQKFFFNFFLALSLLFTGWPSVSAQSDDHLYGFLSDLQVTVKSGPSQLITELSSEGPTSEFNNQAGLSYGIEISKQLSRNWESGVEFGSTILRGKTDSPDFSAFGNHSSFTPPFSDPVFYRNRLLSSRAFVQFNGFWGQRDFLLLPFVRAGVGLLQYKSELRYNDGREDNFIFGKRVEDYKDAVMSTAVYNVSPGLRLSLTAKVKLMAAINLNLVNYDFLDVVHNYNKAGERVDAVGLYTDFWIGISVLFNNTGRYNANSISKKQIQSLPFYRPR